MSLLVHSQSPAAANGGNDQVSSYKKVGRSRVNFIPKQILDSLNEYKNNREGTELKRRKISVILFSYEGLSAFDVQQQLKTISLSSVRKIIRAFNQNVHEPNLLNRLCSKGRIAKSTVIPLPERAPEQVVQNQIFTVSTLIPNCPPREAKPQLQNFIIEPLSSEDLGLFSDEAFTQPRTSEEANFREIARQSPLLVEFSESIDFDPDTLFP
jgi:hypothetical protein